MSLSAPIFSPEETVQLLDTSCSLTCHIEGRAATLQFCINGAVVASAGSPNVVLQIVMIPSAAVLRHHCAVRVSRAFPARPELEVLFESESDAEQAQQGLLESQVRIVQSLFSAAPRPPPELFNLKRRPRTGDDFCSLLATTHAVVSQWQDFAQLGRGRRPHFSLYWLELVDDGVDGQGSSRPSVPLHCYESCQDDAAHVVTFNMPKDPRDWHRAGQSVILRMDSALGKGWTVFSFFSVNQAQLWQRLVWASYDIRETGVAEDIPGLIAQASADAVKCTAHIAEETRWPISDHLEGALLTLKPCRKASNEDASDNEPLKDGVTKVARPRLQKQRSDYTASTDTGSGTDTPVSVASCADDFHC